MLSFESLKEQIAGKTTQESIAWLNDYIAENPGNCDALTLRGMRYWSLGNRSEAINNYLAALKIDPECKAKQALKATNDILDYYNKDLYNP